MTLYLFNTTIAVIPDEDSEAQFSYKKINLQIAKNLVNIDIDKEIEAAFDERVKYALMENDQAGAFVNYGIDKHALEQAVRKRHAIVSAIGHESTSQIMSTLLNVDIKVNRINAQLKRGDRALCFKLKGRPAEGAILSAEEVEKIGYEFVLLTRIS